MAVRVDNFVIPESNLGGFYRVNNTIERKQEKAAELQRQQTAKKAASGQFLSSYLNPKDNLTGTNYDPQIVAGFDGLLQKGMQLANEGADTNMILMALSPEVAKLNEYSTKAKLVNERIKSQLAQIPKNAGYDISKLEQETRTNAFMDENGQLKDISTIDPNTDWLTETLRKYPDRVTTDAGFDEFARTSPKFTNTQTVKRTNSKGGFEMRKSKITSPSWMVVDDEGELVPKYEIALEGGNVYWIDMNNGRVIQYSVNGLYPISDYKMTRFWKIWCSQFVSMTSAEIEALGGRPFVYMTVDPRHDELLISLPKLSNTPPKGYLPDYPSTVYPFDILDFQGKVIVYKLQLGEGRPRWLGAMTFYTEGFISIQNNMYSFKQGHIWEHNQTNSSNNFYGVQYTSKVMCVSNLFPSSPKVYNSIAIESNLVPTFVYFYNDYPVQQSSDLVDFSFSDLEGVWYATILRNKLVPNNSGFTTDGLLTGEKMRNVAMYCLLEFSPTNAFLELKYCNFNFIKSLGHTV